MDNAADRIGPADKTRANLSDTERALLATWRESRNRSASHARLDPVEERLVGKWREWRDSPSTRPQWAAVLQQRFSDTGDAEVSAESAGSGPCTEAPNRFLGMALGGAAGEAIAGTTGERTSATLFVLEELIQAHADSRAHGSGDPIRSALDGLQRWFHTRGVAWEDCFDEKTSATAGSLDERMPHATTSDDPTTLTALARIAAGQPHGTRHRPINSGDSATAVPLGALAALWSEDVETGFALAGDLAALTHGAQNGHLPAGVLGVTTSLLLRGESLRESCTRGLAAWRDPVPESLTHALRLGQNSPAGFQPARTQLEAMGAGRNGVDALGIAIRVALACSDDFAAAIRSAADHGGDAATSAMLCGQLLGALHGPAVIPRQWLDELPLRGLVEQLAGTASQEFGLHLDNSSGEAGDSATPILTYRTGFSAAAQLETSRSRFLGAVLGCAVGEALGAPIAAESWDEIKSRHGEAGLLDYVPAGHPAGRLGSDTQLLLFSLEGTIRANVSRRRDGIEDPLRHIQHAYQRWLHTQHLSWGRAAGEFLQQTPEPDGWLVEQRALFQTRNPGRTMMRTLIAFAKGQQAMGTPESPVSDSKGSTAVLRAVPAALWTNEPADVFRVGMNAAALTHGHPMAYLSAGSLAFLISRLIRGEGLRSAADDVLGVLGEHAGYEEVRKLISAALRLADSGLAAPEDLERSLGNGSAAPEALAIGLYAALVSDGDFDVGVSAAVNHSGNSATTGAVCGSLMGALLGGGKIPERWVADLELAEVVEQLGQDAILEFGPRPPQEPDWFERYPAT